MTLLLFDDSSKVLILHAAVLFLLLHCSFALNSSQTLGKVDHKVKGVLEKGRKEGRSGTRC